MGAKNLSEIEIDAIGEILNISLGASATAVSTLLNARVDITTPVVSVKARDEFEFSSIEPAVGVEIGYVDGLDGKNIMLLKRNDVRVIVEMLMGMEIPDEQFELDEMNISAVCEVMNQMMGASATALSELLSKSVNISTPVSFEISSPELFKEKYFTEADKMVVVRFNLSIAEQLESEFLNLMPISLAKELVKGFFPDMEEEEEEPEKSPAPVFPKVEPAGDGGVMSQEEIERMMQGMSSGAEAASAQPAPAAPAQSGGVMSQEEIERMMQNMSQGGAGGLSQAAAPAMQTAPQTAPAMQMAPPPAMQMAPQAAPAQMAGQPAPVQAAPQAVSAQPVYVAPAMDPAFMNSMMQMMDMMRQSLEQQQKQIQELAPKKVKVNSTPSPNLRGGDETVGDNLDLMMDVPMEISVEIGRTRKLVKDILELNKGSLVVLDKVAGEQVDLFVNGQCIAKGDVVVVDDNFGIRITEIL